MIPADKAGWPQWSSATAQFRHFLSYFQTNWEHMAGLITCNVALQQRPHEAPACGQVQLHLQLWVNAHVSGLHTHTHTHTSTKRSGKEGVPSILCMHA